MTPRTSRASPAGRATACPGTSPPRCPSADTGTGSCARRAASRGAPPRRSRTRGAPPPPPRAAPSPCHGRGRRSVATPRCARATLTGAGQVEPRRASRTAAGATDAARERRARAPREEAGFDSAWAPEFHNHSGPLALAAAALETERIELGTAIAWAFGRSPLLTAVTALDLDEMSGGRFSLGLGTGTRRMRTDWLGAPAERPARRLRETVEAVRAVWAGAERRRDRLRGRAGEAAVRPVRARGPGAGAIPVYLAAVNEGMSRMAGAIADGVVAHPMATGRYIEEVMRPAIAEGAPPRAARRRDVEVDDWVAPGGVRRPRAGARGRQAPDRLPCHRANLRPHPRPARLQRRRGARSGSSGSASTWAG